MGYPVRSLMIDQTEAMSEGRLCEGQKKRALLHDVESKPGQTIDLQKHDHQNTHNSGFFLLYSVR